MSVESDRAHRAFAAHLRLDFPLASDFNRVVVKQFGIDYLEHEAYTGLWGMSRRAVHVLDSNAVIRYVWVTDDPGQAPDVEEVLRAVAGMRDG
jgi:peroxiredoxin